MNRKVFLLLLFFFPWYLAAQFTDDFSDGDFTHNPEWIGDTDKFIVEEQQLRLNDNDAGDAYLVTQSSRAHNTQWEFWVRLAFTPSNNNHPRIYLVSDSDDLSAPLNGYYIRIGKNGTDNKRLYFYRQTGDTHTEIMEGSSNLAALSNNRLRIKALRDEAGNWEFLADPNGNTFFMPQGTVFDNEHTETQWFGLHCLYTSSNSTGFFFDDFYVGDIIPDDTPPEVSNVVATSSRSLEVLFSKAVDPAYAESATNYFVSAGIGAPASAALTPDMPNKVVLEFDNDFQMGETYTLTIVNIQDYSGNMMPAFTGEFAWYQAQRYDIVFNEIMANPEPVNELPPYEYTELYNTSAFPINMEGWTFQHGTTKRELPFAIIPPGGYLVLTHANGLEALESYGNVIAVPGLSASALVNSGTTLMLWDQHNELVSFVSYADSWYDDPEKANGGWSLEKIDPYNYCGEASNWRASADSRGGSPGEENAVMAENPDTIAPVLLGAVVENAIEVTLYFSEIMEEEPLALTENYMIKGAHPLSAAPKEPGFKEVTLILSEPLAEDVIYEVFLSDAITDCAGNTLAESSVPFARYQPEPFDIVFNELMANPNPAVELPEVRYAEVYNTSPFPIHLRGWTLSHGTTQRELPFIPVMPGGFAVLSTPAGAAALEDFPHVYAVPGLSVNFLTIGGTTLSLTSAENEVISFVSYDETWYGDPSKAEGGWALEKIDPLNFCEGAANWQASVAPAGGTPGTENSVRAENPDTTPPLLLRAGYEEPNRISLFFSEPMDVGSLKYTGHYSVEPAISKPLQVVLHWPENRRVDLLLAEVLQPDIHYEVLLSENITDCAANPLDRNQARVAVPQPSDSLDLVINEILFNPPDRGVRYVEVYNRSPKVIDLKNLILASKDTLEGVFSGTRQISSESHLIFPEEYRVLTPNPRVVKEQYMTNNPLGFISMPLSPMTNNSGIVVLATQGQQIIDKMIYDEDMHYALLNDKKGVALERLHYDRPTSDRTNWHSAAANVGFGTPGFKNSQFTLNLHSGEETFELFPRVFSPNNDGVDDVLNIGYELSEPGYTANLTVYDSRGRHIKTLYRSELLGTSGVLTWDGTTDDYQKADIGIYIIFVELFEPGGSVKTFRKTAVLGGRL